MEAEDSWRKFGPPARVLRWCCHVHKSVPQTLKLCEILNKKNYRGMDFVGVRAHESTARSTYDYENYGKKQKGQYSHNSILDWSSVEIWLYIFSNKLIINNAYKKGNSRAGCLFCPMGGGKGDAIQMLCYKDDITKYIDIIKSINVRDVENPVALESYIANGGWNARKNGRDLKIGIPRYQDKIIDGKLVINVTSPMSNWLTWIKTLCEAQLNYSLVTSKNGYTVSTSEYLVKEQPTLFKMFKQVFKKAAHCVGCRLCETNCRNGCISFMPDIKIDNCQHCGLCHDIDDGCLAYHSLRLPHGGGRTMKSLNSFANHAPKLDWVKKFFEKKSSYWTDNDLGPNQVPMFKRFLREGGLLHNNEITHTTEIVSDLGFENENSWGIILSNLAYNAQCAWYIRNLEIGRQYTREIVSDMLVTVGVSKNDATSIINAFKRLCDLPLGTKLNFGSVTEKGRQIESLARNKCHIGSPLVVLYSLYKFAEACGGYHEFTVNRLLNYNIDSDGISPTLIFGIDEDELKIILQGLTASNTDFISAKFTHDLDTISLNKNKTSGDVLSLL
jgi:phosphoadenosine phosphosulfate reductase